MSYFTLLTKVGQALIASAHATGTPVKLTHLAVGDGEGVQITPREDMTALRREVWRGALNTLSEDPQNPGWIMAEAVVPETTGGFTIREVGLFDETGNLVAVGSLPDSYKPQLAEGSAKTFYIRMRIEISNASSVTLLIDPSVVLATKQYVTIEIGKVRADVAALAVEVVEHLGDHANPHEVTAAQVGIVPASVTVQGIVELATDAEVVTGTDTARAVTPAGVAAAIAGSAPSTASETVSGIVELATNAEVVAGTDAVRAVTPAGLAARTATDVRAGIVELATSAEVVTGTDTARAVTPAGVAAAIAGSAPAAASETASGIVELATSAEVVTGTDAARAVTPAGLAARTATEARAGIVERATEAEVLAGEDTERYICPADLTTRLAALPAPAVVTGVARDLAMNSTGLSALVSMTADELIVKDAAGNAKLLSGLALSASTAVAGAGGRDTGAIAGGTWYAVWAIAKADGTAALLLSLSATAPTLPAGYSYMARVGWVRTDSTANKYPLAFKQIGKSVRYIVAPGTNVTVLSILASGTIGSITTPTYVQASVAAHVPATASAICISGGIHAPADTAGLLVSPNGNYGVLNSTTNPAHLAVDGGTGSSSVIPYTMVLESMNVLVAGVNCIITCRGWEDNI